MDDGRRCPRCKCLARRRCIVQNRAHLDKSLPRQEVIVPRKTVVELSKLLDDSEDPVALRFNAAIGMFSTAR